MFTDIIFLVSKLAQYHQEWMSEMNLKDSETLLFSQVHNSLSNHHFHFWGKKDKNVKVV